MKRPIASLNSGQPRHTSQPRMKASYSTSFANQLQQAADARSSSQGAAGAGSGMLVGEISRSRQTVSELLMQHRELKDSTWSILSNAVNRGKDYTRLAPGTRIYYDPADGSLSWSGDVGKSRQAAAAAAFASVKATMPPPAVRQELAIEQVTASTTTSLGVISREQPTVSHLLKAHSDLANSTWRILASAVNRNKDFSRLAPGTEVTIDPVSQEIRWNAAGELTSSAASSSQTLTAYPAKSTRPEAVAAPPPEVAATASGTAAEKSATVVDLTEAVKPFLGKNYKDINCYELLVKGLERMNIPYKGKDGLFTKLTRMAREQGLPANAYLNGEGVVKAAGSLVLSKNYPKAANWQREAEQLYREMEPLLSKGQILSFSTRRRGHTGIISQQDQQWTFINSGRLDNSLSKDSPRKGVGEENLQQEIRNWFKLASTSGESLSVTLGTLGQEQIVTASNEDPTLAGPRRI